MSADMSSAHNGTIDAQQNIHHKSVAVLVAAVIALTANGARVCCRARMQLYIVDGMQWLRTSYLPMLMHC